MVVNLDFWKSKKVLLTGHTGFKGAWLSLWLQSLGANVVGYSIASPTKPNLFEMAQVADGMVSMIGDVRDLIQLQSALTEHRPEIVIHMAAQSLVRYSYVNPVETYATNVMGTVHVLEAIRQVGSVKAAVIVTSDKCYENHEWVWGYRENEPMGGHDPYSNSKGCAELVTSAYRRSYHNGSTAVASARAGNVIGGGDWAEDRLIPDMMRAVVAGRVVSLRNPQAIRPWQHVLEPLSGYLMLAERLYVVGQTFAEGWNFGPAEEDAKSVEWIAQEIASLWEGMRWEKDHASHPHEAHYLKLDCSKARTRLGWVPRLSLADALLWTVLWYKAYDNGLDMRSLSEQQIKQYSGLI